MHMMMMMISGSIILAAVAYWLMVTSMKEQGGLKTLGAILGWIALIYAIICFVSSFFAPRMMRHEMMMGKWGMGGGMMSQEMMEKQKACMDMMQQKSNEARSMEQKQAPVKK